MQQQLLKGLRLQWIGLAALFWDWPVPGDERNRAMTDPLSGGRVHIIGIGGIGMSAIAEIMTARGFSVQGSDQKDGANLRRLASKGIKVFASHDAAHLAGASAVVISTAVKEANPELRAARIQGLPVFTRAQTLAALMRGYRTISITGSHGKTTTTAMIGWLLEKAGLDPTVLVGGVVSAWGSNARIGKSPWMVVEADESDGTFIKLPTEIGVVTNIDPEHLDYYGTEAALHAAFLTFLRQIPKDGLAVAGVDHPVVRNLLNHLAIEGALPPLLSYGRAPEANIRVDKAGTHGGSVTFELRFADVPGYPLTRKRSVKLEVPGLHNAINAAAAAAVGQQIGLSPDTIVEALASFTGVDRRFTRTGEWNGVEIYDDYAHHPTEIAAALNAARGAAKGQLIAVMQPHRFSRLKALFDGFSQCFREADIVLIAPVYPAGEAPNGFDRDRLIEGIRTAGHPHVYPIENEETLTSAVATLARPGDLVIGLGAGTVSEWARALPMRLSHHTILAGAAE
jgi:UDP-N-acetylmuramate--alanine ligase